MTVEERALTPTEFFATLKVRELMLRAARPVRCAALARYLKVDRKELGAELHALCEAGLALDGRIGFILTDEGEASVRWAAPMPPDGVIRPWWVTDLARACAEHYGVSVSDLLHAMNGTPVVARSRLCFALFARGWPLERIEEHFALPPGWARRAVERWKRLRDQVLPKTGPELRAWRERLKLTQAQAAARLGVSRRTVIRAERTGALSARAAIGRA